MRSIRGADIAMIFQEPMTSLNPVFTAGEQIAESIRLHQGMDRGGSACRGAAHAGAGAHSRGPQCARPLSAPALGRHAPARDDCHGALVQAMRC
jgi:ABC-type dipeptide/oligopeptide/nickel transport system ATPase component